MTVAQHRANVLADTHNLSFVMFMETNELLY
jgi:hypothetical protein